MVLCARFYGKEVLKMYVWVIYNKPMRPMSELIDNFKFCFSCELSIEPNRLLVNSNFLAHGTEEKDTEPEEVKCFQCLVGSFDTNILKARSREGRVREGNRMYHLERE